MLLPALYHLSPASTSPEVEAVILDMGNVLIFHDDQLLFRRLGERAGLPAAEVQKRITGPSWDIANRGEMTGEEIWRGICGSLGLQLAAGEFNELFCCHFRVHTAVMPLVQSLVGQVELVLLSNANSVHVEHIRPLLPVLNDFDHVLFSCELGMSKPDPRFYKEALRRAGSAPEKTAYFDDIEAYLPPARALGIRAFQFTDAARFAIQLRELGLPS
jgi:putative hydrolase of the HAD superfamily